MNTGPTASTTSTTYGRERDRLAHALAELLAAPDPRLRRAETAHVLAYRDLLLTNLCTITDQVLGAAASVDTSLAAAAHNPPRALRTTLHRLPAAAATDHSPTDTLAGRPATAYARTWRTAAQSSLLAADALAAGEPTTWRTDPDAAWAVMADTAAATHALAVLDRRLATHPTAHLHDTSRDALRAGWRTGLTLVASEVSRLAHTQPLSAAADQLTRPPRPRPFPLNNTEPTQLAAGYQHTLRLLRARDGMLPLRTLGHLLVAQARLGHTLADHCQHAHAAGVPGLADTERLAQQWRAHATTAETLAGHRRAVAGLHPGVHHPVLTQFGEVLRALEHLPHPARGQDHRDHQDLVATARHLLPTANRIEHTLAAGIERSFARDLYLVANESTTKVRGRHPWVSVRHNLEPHPLLLSARGIQDQDPDVQFPAPRTVAAARAETIHQLERVVQAAQQPRNRHPAMRQP